MDTMSNIALHLLVCCTMLIFKTDAHYMYGFNSCEFSSEDGHDAVIADYIYYNKQLIGSYSSTEGKFIGYTEKTKEIAYQFNKNQHYLQKMKNELKKCKKVVPHIVTALEGSAQKPQVRVFSTKTANGDQPGIIVCSAYNFYPKPITLTWLRNGEEITSDVISNEEMSNGNWLYQKHSFLEYTPTAADTIHCMVQHASLSTTELYKWEYFSESRKYKILVGTAGLLLGLAFTTVGALYYMKHTKGLKLVPKY